MAGVVKCLLETAPETASVRDTYDNTALFTVLQAATCPQPHRGTLQVVQYLLAACPEAASQMAVGGKFPLHLIAPAVNAAALDIAKALYHAYPAALGIRDRGGNYPCNCAQTKEMRELLQSWDAEDAPLACVSAPASLLAAR